MHSIKKQDAEGNHSHVFSINTLLHVRYCFFLPTLLLTRNNNCGTDISNTMLPNIYSLTFALLAESDPEEATHTLHHVYL